MRSPRWIVLAALAVLVFTPGCALVNLLVDYPTPTPPPQRALRPTFTPTATRETPAEAVVQAPEATPAPPVEQSQEQPAEQTEQQAPPADQPPPTEVPPEPTATPTPFVVVSNEIARVRSGPGVDYEQVGELAQGAQLTVLARNDGGDWWQVCCVNDQPAWISGDLVALQGSADAVAVALNVPPPPTPTPSPTPQPEVVVANPRVNVRSQPAADAPVLGQVLSGARLQIVGRNETGDWWQVCCFEGESVWIAAEVVQAQGPLELVALSPDLPTATPVPPEPTPTVQAAGSAVTPEPAQQPGSLAFAAESYTFPFNQDYLRVAARVVDAASAPLEGYYLRVLNEATGQQWISAPSEDAWQVTAPNAAFADFREANVFFDTRGKAPLAANAYAVWLVDGRGHRLSPVVRLAQTDDEFQWLYVVFSGQ